MKTLAWSGVVAISLFALLTIGEVFVHDHDKPGREFMENFRQSQLREIAETERARAVMDKPIFVMGVYSSGDDILFADIIARGMNEKDKCWVAKAGDFFASGVGALPIPIMLALFFLLKRP